MQLCMQQNGVSDSVTGMLRRTVSSELLVIINVLNILIRVSQECGDSSKRHNTATAS